MDIYMDYTTDQAQKLSDLFEVGLDMNNFIISLNNTNNQEIKDNSPDHFVNWINEFHELKSNEEAHFDYDDLDINLRVSYVKFNESILNVILLENIVQNKNIENLLTIDMFKFKDIYFEFIFYDEDIDNLYNDDIINKPWNESLFNVEDYYSTVVDNIGNRFYYLKKNFRLYLLHQQKSLNQKAKDEFQEFLDKGTTITPEELLKHYNKRYDKNELDKLIKSHLNIINKRNRVDIYFYYEDL